MKIPCTGIILSGGENSRFKNINKAFRKVGSLKILENIFLIFQNIFEHIIIVSNNPSLYIDFNCLIVRDHYSFRSSLNGIYSGLLYSPTKYSFFVACDMPFIKKKVIKYIISEIEETKDIIVPKIKFGFEPLFAVYSKKCIKTIEKQIKTQNFKIIDIFNKLHIKTISPNKIAKLDVKMTTFFNINTQTDLNKAKNFLKINPNIL